MSKMIRELRNRTMGIESIKNKSRRNSKTKKMSEYKTKRSLDNMAE